VGLRHRAQRAARGAAPRARRAPCPRRLGVEPPALEAEEQIRIEELAALGELRSAVQGALAELGPEQREAVRLRVVDELGYPAVAARLGVSEQTARARVSRGLRALAAAVDRHEIGPERAA
jgi:RNA polymerase sigma-70 factor (ECF subfamily)